MTVGQIKLIYVTMDVYRYKYIIQINQIENNGNLYLKWSKPMYVVDNSAIQI